MPQSVSTTYWCVNEFIQTVVDACALKSAFELRLIDHLSTAPSGSIDDLASSLHIDASGVRLLIDLLRRQRSGLRVREGQIALTERFSAALKYRDLLEATIAFANLAAGDFINLLTPLLQNSDRFKRESRIFNLFDYGQAFQRSPQAHQRTKQWMRFTTVLTRYEAGACIEHFDFGPYRRLLDIGGNSGEFAMRICRRHPDIRATVLDLPLVCDIGRAHVRSEPEAARISFISGNALEDVLPGDFDLITFKSMLHDWPDGLAVRLLENATRSLAPGGTILIFERSPIEVADKPVPYWMLPMLLFFRSFRPAQFYADQLARLGYQNIRSQRMELDMPFHLVTASRPR